MINVSIDKASFAALDQLLAGVPKAMEKVVVRSINRTLTATRAEMIRLIRTEYAIKAGAVRQELEISRASQNKPEGRIAGEQSPGVPLIEFVAMRRIPSTKRTAAGGYTPKTGVPVRVKRASGRKTVAGAFTARMRSGHAGAFRRDDAAQSGRKLRNSDVRVGQSKAGKRYIKELYGPTPIMLLGSKDNLAKIEAAAQEALDKNLAREANYILSKEGLK